jgi:hypothetical protein
MAEVRILQDQVVLDPVVAPLFLFLARYVLQIMASLLEEVVVADLILATGMVVLVVEVVRFMVPPALVQHGQAQVQAGQVKHQQVHLLRAAQAEER